ncbi:hypothetical protein GR7B_00021 [Vibrio phage vB_VcorM_GR7B]|nr:hypothetical protein GR7B_00021 [Vibrio phage vB_VcorM_GR7B]
MGKNAKVLDYMCKHVGEELTADVVADGTGLERKRVLVYLATLAKDIDSIYRVRTGVYIYSPDKEIKLVGSLRDKIRQLVKEAGGKISANDLADKMGRSRKDVLHVISLMQQEGEDYQKELYVCHVPNSVK